MNVAPMNTGRLTAGRASRLLRPLVLPILAFCIAAVPPAWAQGNLRLLRFRLPGASQAKASPATFYSPVTTLEMEFEATAAELGGEAVDLALRAPDGLLLAQRRVDLSGTDWKAYSVAISGRQLCSTTLEGWQKAWRNLIASANRLASARAGHQEYLMQLHADALVLMSHRDFMARVAVAPAAEAGLADVSNRTSEAQRKVLVARDIDPQDTLAIQNMAKEIGADGQAALAPMDALVAAAPCPDGLAWPAYETQDYDLTLSSGGFPSLSGELRIVGRPKIFLPRLSRP